MSNQIIPIIMPKWGLSMQEGRLTSWHVEEGDTIELGQEIMDVETDKIANAVEAADVGVLRRRIGEEDVVYPVRALLGVLASAEVSDAEIDSYVAGFVMPEIDDEDVEEAPTYLFAETSAGRLRYAERGSEGDPIVLVHGFGGDLDNWLFNLDALEGVGHVFALDLPGHGQSVKTAGGGIESLVDALASFMETVGIDAAHFVGHSMGGAVCAMLSLTHSDRVKSLTLVDTAGLGPEINAEYIDGFVAAETRRELKPVVQHLFADKSLVSRQMIDDLLKYKRLDGVDEALRAISTSAFSGGVQSTVLAEKITSSGIPVLVIWGADDAIIPVSHANAIVGAKVKVISDAGHMPQMEAANQVNDFIRGFLNEIP